MPAMLDDPAAPLIMRSSGDGGPYATPGGPLPVGIAPSQVTLRDRVTTATIIPFSAPNQVPLTLLTYLCDQLGREIEKGDTYPMVEPLPLESFGPYWFGIFGAIMLLGEIEDGRALHEMARQGCDWERECLGSFYIKPNYPGRSSHVCNGGFLVTDASRNRGVGRLMGESYLDWAPKLGYTYSVFNLVYETNLASCRIWDALGFKRIGRVKECGNLKSHPGELIDAIIYGRDLGQDDDLVSEERFDKIRFYLKNGKYPNGADRAEKSRLRSAATHYKLTPATDHEAEKLWLKGKEVISDTQRQYEIAREVHHKAHGGINKTTAAIAESFHWVRIKETVSQVIRNCPECSEMNKGLSAMRATQSQSRPSQSQTQPSNAQQQQQTQSQQYLPPPADPTHLSLPSDPSFPPQRADSPSYQLQVEAQVHPDQSYPPFTGNAFDIPLDPALIHSPSRLADLPPSPFLAAENTQHTTHLGEDVPNFFNTSNGSASGGAVANSTAVEYAHTGGPARRPLRARAEMRRRLDGVARYAWHGAGG
jgi:GNAT superfamily N-acetyltransferase